MYETTITLMDGREAEVTFGVFGVEYEGSFYEPPSYAELDAVELTTIPDEDGDDPEVIDYYELSSVEQSHIDSQLWAHVESEADYY